MHLPQARCPVFVLIACTACTTLATAQTIQLASTNPQVEGQFGNAVSAVPDVDGDGMDDVIVGAWLEDTSGVTDSGRAYLFSGANGALLRPFSSPNLSPPTQDDARFGCSVAGLHDVNGDSFGDIVIGAYREDQPGNPGDTGRAFVFSGATGALLHTLVSPNQQTNSFFGFTVAALPDVDGDGIDDIAVAALLEAAGSTNLAGRVHLYSGATGAFLRTVISNTPQGNGRFGWSLAGLADVTGDGLGDLAVGTYLESVNGTSSAGRVYVFNGATGAVVQPIISPHVETSGGFGFALSAIPHPSGNDVWLLIGAYQENPVPGHSDAGQVYLISSGTWSVVRTLTSPSDEAGGKFGYSVAAVPDLTGDSEPELAVGARYENGIGGSLDAGRVHIFSSANGNLVQTFDSPNEENTGACGYAIAPIRDSNGDGLGDLAVGAIMEDPATNPDNSGRAYIVSIGGCPGPRGDFDNDNAVTPADVSGFVTALINGPSSPSELCRTDMNQDGAADGRDIAAFTECILGQACP